jgi:rfaE bifunctional protein kinase chain/domain
MILVIGDYMIDEYVHVAIDRISPEAPVPIMRELRREAKPGGAGNVAANIASLGEDVRLLTVVGDDYRYAPSVHTPWMGWIVDDKRKTTIKTRFVAERGQQVARLDCETTDDISHATVARMNDSMQLDDVKICVISDYVKGVVTPSLARLVIDRCRARNIPVIVNSKSDSFWTFSGASLFTCNEREYRDGGENKFPGATPIIMTRGSKGMKIFNGANPVEVPGRPVEVGDVTGAGDTVVAALAVFFKRAGFSSARTGLINACEFANHAASIAVSHRGTHAVAKEEIADR